MNMHLNLTSKFGVLLLASMATGAFAQQTDWSNKDINVSFRSKNIDGFNFKNAKAVKNVTDFNGSNATHSPVSFREAKLQEVHFQNSVMNDPDFRDANLDKAILSGADLRGANFKGASLKEANLYRATLLDSKFPKSNLENARLDAMKVSDQADFSDANLKNASVIDVDLTQADFSDANLTNTNFSRSLMGAANLSGATIVKTDFTA